MFVRKKRNRSGSISVQIIDKSIGCYRVAKSAGSFSDPEEIPACANSLYQHTLMDHLCKYPGQMNTVLLRKFPRHILKCKTKHIST